MSDLNEVSEKCKKAERLLIADDDKETLRDLVKILESENFLMWSLALDTQHAIQLSGNRQSTFTYNFRNSKSKIMME